MKNENERYNYFLATFSYSIYMKEINFQCDKGYGLKNMIYVSFQNF